jgi:hypothetical protein
LGFLSSGFPIGRLYCPEDTLAKDMSRTDNISLLASVLGFVLAVYGIFTQPIVVESARPTQTGAGETTKSEVPAYARLWDDPFAVYSDVYNPSPPNPRLPQERQKTLFLVIPTKTFAYEEDKENRLRIRYAVQQALFDKGFVAVPGNLISTVQLAPAGSNDSATGTSSVSSCREGTKAPGNAPSQKEMSAPCRYLKNLHGRPVSPLVPGKVDFLQLRSCGCLIHISGRRTNQMPALAVSGALLARSKSNFPHRIVTRTSGSCSDLLIRTPSRSSSETRTLSAPCR